MTDVYPRIETGNAAPASPPRLLDVVRGKVSEVQDQFSHSNILRPPRLAATGR